MGSIDWGDAPTWIAGVFAAAAAYYARGTLRSQQKQIREQREFIAEQSATLALERAELSAAAEERKWAQARQVRMRIWTARRVQRTWVRAREGYERWDVEVENGSSEPVRAVKVRFGASYTASEAYDLAHEDLPGGGRLGAPVPLIGPGRTFLFVSPNWPETTVDNNRPHVYFTDDAGLRWHLNEHGQLTERPQGEPE
ncbi:hypothetical protein ACWDSL_51725 [Streptomyces sp. NPDC000941]